MNPQRGDTVLVVDVNGESTRVKIVSVQPCGWDAWALAYPSGPYWIDRSDVDAGIVTFQEP